MFIYTLTLKKSFRSKKREKFREFDTLKLKNVKNI